MDWKELLSPWFDPERVPVKERLFTPWAHPGWYAWNEHAMEVQVAEFLSKVVIASLKVSESPFLIVETGLGQGYVSRAILRPLLSPAIFPAQQVYNNLVSSNSENISPAQPVQYFAYESDNEWRVQLKARWGEIHFPLHLKDDPTPTVHEMYQADMVILDSNEPWRMAELLMWQCSAKPGSILFVHDTDNGHPNWDGHFTMGQLIRTLKLPGKFLENPRGAFVAVRDAAQVPSYIDEIWTATLEQVWQQW